MQKNGSDGILGSLVNNNNKKEFRNEELRRNKDFIIEKCVSKERITEYLNKNYELYKEYKSSCWLKKKKDFDTLFEDKIWLLFKKMGFEELNVGYDFKINVTPQDENRLKTKQVDVFVKDCDIVFYIECKANESQGPRSLRKDIAEVKDNKIHIERAIKQHYGERKKVIYLFCTKNIVWNKNDVADAKGADILIWNEPTISYFKKLSEHISSAAKYQLFAFILRDKELEELPAVPAIRGEMGGKTYYLFMIQPEKLLSISYVHHRSPIHLGYLENIEEGNAYQRMIDKSRRQDIDKFISKGGFFANNIIVNFTNEPSFVMSNKVESIETGFLKLPRKPASAWIIDGQHRLYGYADNPKRKTEMMPVLAFCNMTIEDEGELFVTINKEQKSVEANLLWDLYGDIYEEAEDDEEQYLCTISKIIKNLNNGPKSPFYNKVYIPSFNDRENRLTIVTIANAFKKSYHGLNLIKKSGLLFRENWKTTESFATNRIESFFNIIKDKIKEDWDKNENGFVCSNNGIAILIRMLPEFIRYINYKHPGTIDRANLGVFERCMEDLISPFVDYLKEIADDGRDVLRRSASAEDSRNQIADNLLSKVKKCYNEFAPHLPPTEEEMGKKLIEETELAVRSLIKQKLKEKYGDKWWKQGATSGAKQYAKNHVDDEIKSAPWMKDKIETNLERRIELLTIGHYKEIITYSDNWGLFESIFGDKKEVIDNFEGFATYRNGIDHIRDFPDEIIERKSFLCMRWIRKCLNLE